MFVLWFSNPTNLIAIRRLHLQFIKLSFLFWNKKFNFLQFVLDQTTILIYCCKNWDFQSCQNIIYFCIKQFAEIFNISWAWKFLLFWKINIDKIEKLWYEIWNHEVFDMLLLQLIEARNYNNFTF